MADKALRVCFVLSYISLAGSFIFAKSKSYIAPGGAVVFSFGKVVFLAV